MQWSHEHDQLRDTTRRLIEAEVNPYVDAWEAAEIYPAHEVMKKFGDAGLLGISKPVEFGGLGLDYSYEIAFAEEMGRIKANGVSTSIGVQTNMATPALAQYGSDELRREYLTPSIAGDLVGAIGVSEEGAGSDVASVKTAARKDGGDYVINGSKMWITNGIQGDWICLLCNTSEENQPHGNKSLIVVPLKAKGVSVARKLDKLGLRCSDTAQLFFDDVRVPKYHRIGEENRGFTYQMEQFQEERLFSIARTMLALETLIDETIDYTRERKAFGQSILDNQVVHFKLAELASKLEAVRSLLYRATEDYVGGKEVTRLASMGKYLVGKLSQEVPMECLQFWGGQGFMNENRISRAYRDMRVASIGGGANEVMLQIVCKIMGTLPRRRNH